MRADAHIHLFYPGYPWPYGEAGRRRDPDEATLYELLVAEHRVERALVVGYEGEPWAAGNNEHIARTARSRPRFKALAFVTDPATLAEALLDELQQRGFVGLSMYVFGEAMTGSVARVPDAAWRWLVQRRWLVSVNSRGADWACWDAVLARHPELRLLVSHLGLPPASLLPPDASAAAEAVRPITGLARFPGTHVKLSGFYALANPAWDYPYRAAWPYVERLVEAFGPSRLVWGSDYSPCLAWMSFPQSFDLFRHMPFLTAADRRAIEGANLLRLLDQVR